MEKKLTCVLLLPLKEMTLRKVAILLWSGSDVLASVSNFRFSDLGLTDDDRKDWRETLEPKIKDKVSNLELPESVAKEVIDLVRPIGFEIRRWKNFHEERYQSVEIGLPGSTKLCWTTVGRIDDRRTAEYLVRCGEMSVVQRYAIACNYCLVDCIPLLWEELPEDEKDYFFNGESYSLRLDFHWPYILIGKQSKLDYLWISEDRNLTSFNQWAFEESAYRGYKSAAVHFFQKLTHKEREVSLLRSAQVLLARIDFSFYDVETTSDVMCYLLSLMTPKQQMESFKRDSISILMIFLRWPLQDLFLENASLLWTSIPPSCYGDLLWRMAHRFRSSELCFPKLFQEFFIQSPLALKKHFVYQESYTTCHFLSTFIDFEDSESIEVIFRNVDAVDRLELVCHHRILQFFHKEILRDKCHMVEVCLREAMLSEVDRKRMEKAFLRHCHLNWEDSVFKSFLELLNDTYPSSDKVTKARKRRLSPEE